MITRSRLALAILGATFFVVGAHIGHAAPPRTISTPPVTAGYRPGAPVVVTPGRPIGGDWWRTYPWSQYNAWRNPYWYPPYNTNYPYPPNAAYPYYSTPAPWNPYLVPGGVVGSMHN